VEFIDEQDLNVYIDGSSFSGPRRGGIGIVFITEGPDGHWLETPYDLPGFAGATNNQMELKAPIEALHALARGRVSLDPANFRKVVIWTDSKYVAENYDNARVNWPRSRWMTRDGNPVSNTELWKELVRLAGRTGRPVEFRWVKGHKNSFLNKLADKLAKASAKSQVLNRPLDARKVRRRTTTEQVQRGSVQMHGQHMTIRLIEELDQSAQGLVRFEYEVMSKRSPYVGKVDFIWAERGTHLRAGHAYRERVNKNTQTPRILKVFAEVDGK
jgi:ribonuclease HI